MEAEAHRTPPPEALRRPCRTPCRPWVCRSLSMPPRSFIVHVLSFLFCCSGCLALPFTYRDRARPRQPSRQSHLARPTWRDSNPLCSFEAVKSGELQTWSTRPPGGGIAIPQVTSHCSALVGSLVASFSQVHFRPSRCPSPNSSLRQ